MPGNREHAKSFRKDIKKPGTDRKVHAGVRMGARERETREPSPFSAATKPNAGTSTEAVAGNEETAEQEGHIINLDGPEYDVLLKRLEENEIARNAKVSVAEDEAGDTEAAEKAGYVSPSTSSDGVRFTSTSSRFWRRNKKQRYTNTHFLFERENHSE